MLARDASTRCPSASFYRQVVRPGSAVQQEEDLPLRPRQPLAEIGEAADLIAVDAKDDVANYQAVLLRGTPVAHAEYLDAADTRLFLALTAFTETGAGQARVELLAGHLLV